MSELGMKIRRLVRFCIDWKGDDVRYEESLKQETVTKFMEIIQQERVKAEKNVMRDMVFNEDCADCECNKANLDILKQSLAEENK